MCYSWKDFLMDMTFQKRNIRASQRKKAFSRLSLSFFQKCKQSISAPFQFFAKRRQRRGRIRALLSIAGIIFALILIGEVSIRAFQFFTHFETSDLLGLVGSDLPEDQYGHTNILLLGVGGDEHSGGTLTDTIMIASVDQKQKNAVLLSIPRDFYVQTAVTQGRINEVIRDVMTAYKAEAKDEGYNEGVQVLKDELNEIFDIDIHRYLQVDFSGFAKGVDALGGIDVIVESSIDDELYPNKDWGYEHFFLEEGAQHLDGETALKYARSRHGSSDFERSKRQRKVITAIQNKALSREILTSPSKIKELYSLVDGHVKTDFSLREMISFAELGTTLSAEKVISFGLNNDETKPGGFLVTPDRELYGGAFVLVPFLNLTNNKYERIRIFADNIFRKRWHTRDLKISIFNGTKITGLAGETAVYLERFGIPVTRVNNSDVTLEQTEIQFVDTHDNRQLARLLRKYFLSELVPLPVPKTEKDADPPYGVTITVGTKHSLIRIPQVLK